MIEIMKWLLFLFIGLGLAQRLCWWFGKRYFPFDWKICAWVYDNKSRWWKKAGELLIHKPKGATVMGFLCALLWPLLIGLNVLILAQILELFLSGGKRISIPSVGIYSSIPLTAGILWAIIQTVFGMIFDSIKAKTFRSWFAKVALLLAISISIVGEAGLAVYRARLLTAGQIMISPTQIDIIISQYGPWLAGIIGFFVPIGEILAGTFGFIQFINQIVKSSLYWFGGLMIGGVWGIGVWWICGFYDEEPKPPKEIKIPLAVASLDTDTKELEGEVNKLAKGLQEQKVLSERLDKIRNFNEQKQRVEGLKKRIEDEDWNRQIENILQKIDE